MKYEKAHVEVVVFDDQEFSTIISSGKICFYFGPFYSLYHDASFTCFDVNLGMYDGSYGAHYSECKDIYCVPLGSNISSGWYHCKPVSVCVDQTVP